MAWFSSTYVERQVRPDEPFDAEFPLSLVDGVMPKINSRYLFIWDTRKDTQSNVKSSRAALVDRLENGLQSMLRLPAEGVLTVPELLGKIYENPMNGMLTVKVTKASTISFVVSTRNDITIESLKPEDGYPRKCFSPNTYATGIDATSIPSATVGSKAFSAQITFIKGGYVLCVNKHHSLLDATSTSRFISFWFSKVRSLCTSLDAKPILPNPAHCQTMHDRRPLAQATSVEQQEHPNWRVVPNGGPSVFGVVLPPQWVLTLLKWSPVKLLPEASSHIFHLDADALAKLKSAAETKGRISTNDAVAALFWTSISRARSTPSNPPSAEDVVSSVNMSVNIRGKISPALPDAYFGNAVVPVATTLPLSLLTQPTSDTLATAASHIRTTLTTNTTNQHVQSTLQLFASQPKITDMQMSLNTSSGHDIYMNSWEGLFNDMSVMDLGYGTFQRMRLPGENAFGGFANVMPAYGLRDSQGDGIYSGGVEVMVDLSREQMARLLVDNDFMQYVSRVI